RLQHLEAAVIAGTMTLAGFFVVGPRMPGEDVIPAQLADGAPLAWLLPFMLWAAIRLGPGGLSLTLLGSALVLIGAAVHSHGPFRNLSPETTTLALQLYLIAVSVPLMIVAALIEERRIVQQDISDRLALEALLARLSGAFVKLPSDRMREVFVDSLRQIGEALHLDAVLLFGRTEADREASLLAAWNAPGAEARRESLARREFSFPSHLQQEPIVLSAPEGVGIAAGDPAFPDPGSDIGIPLIAEGEVLGVLACATGEPVCPRASGLVEQLRVVARVLANALARKATEDSLRASEAMKSAILSSLTYGVVVVDREGCIVTINDRWRRIVGDEAWLPGTKAGASYLDLFHEALRSGAVWASKAIEGIAAVLSGASPEFRLEYVRPTPTGNRAIALRAVPLQRPEGGAVITTVDLTHQRRAELEAQRARAELAHVSRVATMGALTASIAHQLNQPLTGILANAQAARRFLAAPKPDLEEVGEILDDIMDDDRRASEVIVRMREFLQKDDERLEDVDLHHVVRDVARLVSSDAVIRNVAIRLELDDEPAIVRGDHVQLQQVVLNLLMNALEALGNGEGEERRIVVRSTRPTCDTVEIAVVDNGVGFQCPEDSAFEALFTTKPGGMGLGLSIARSIVEAHAGAIRAMNNPEGGATVAFRLPVASMAV
ncbi:MAG TPA: ATP-binding protein, partial [Vicinamibacterales bacterium]|nr:ATP-binding protein [Vicinamibacterales bacterium]